MNVVYQMLMTSRNKIHNSLEYQVIAGMLIYFYNLKNFLFLDIWKKLKWLMLNFIIRIIYIGSICLSVLKPAVNFRTFSESSVALTSSTNQQRLRDLTLSLRTGGREASCRLQILALDGLLRRKFVKRNLFWCGVKLDQNTFCGTLRVIRSWFYPPYPV